MTRVWSWVTMVLWLALAAPAAMAQNGVWVQIEARPTLSGAQERVRAYAGAIENVVGYALASGWYAVALGPYADDDARAVLSQLRGAGSIPSDSFIVDGGNFRQQFWPVGVGAPTSPQPLPGGVSANADATDGDDPAAPAEGQTVILPVDEPAAPEPEPEPEPEPDETVYEAQQSEAQLSRDEKMQLQVALQWAGFYDSTIDGLFGRGTRTAMGAWQAANGYEATGVLTTRQRAALFDAYNSVLDGMGLRRVTDRRAGIDMILPMGVVDFAAYDSPFARYEATGDLPVTVLLISQPGDQDRLYGLYEIMQTLEIVPPEGERQRGASSFTLEGRNGRIHSYTEASLENGEIKGFTLVWPANDEERRTRVLNEMRASFLRIDGVLDPALAAAGEEQAVDLVSGLAIRQPIRTRSGVFIDGTGRVLTVAGAVAGCGEVTIDDGTEARVAHLDEALGIAVLQPVSPMAPIGVARFQTGVPRIGSEIAVAGYPFGGVIAAPAVTFGTLADIRGLNGEDEVKRLDIAISEGDAGGPVFDGSGGVLGVLLEDGPAGGPALPQGVHFLADTDALLASIGRAGLQVEAVEGGTAVTRERLTRLGGEVATLVSCWE
ncbi:trypsin-like peptidase domain-containing protein [Wenxinia marina]|uniref:Trypsin-like serine protease, typically periplasmic n=1 Tax=Wenxinia marina DSM 24838 TaxID=1123501 RepID=A0A0D0Q6S0_9RHOB|nr:trypsin-like peptidase domain-containing protein [Wenxinia marina]KIQ68132.1 Trypsin-like serine protease, typically periplasmic [Wenxinia marina DSM 24838]GGL78511.1 peptidoglycan-binding protein [Wenxinia marina]